MDDDKNVPGTRAPGEDAQPTAAPEEMAGEAVSQETAAMGGAEAQVSAPESTTSASTTAATSVPGKRSQSSNVFLLVAAGLTALIGAGVVVERWRSSLPPPPPPELPPVEASDLHGYWEKPPRLVRGPAAAMPGKSLAAITPTIVCRALVGLDGRLKEARVLRQRKELADYEEMALAAFRDYEFEPAEHKGRKLRAWINWPVGFRDPARPTDVLRLKGSDTIGGELAPKLAAEFKSVRSDLSVSVAALGSSAAFTGLFDGTADIGMASRPATSDELMRAAFLGIRMREYVFGHDAIAVIVHPKNPVRELSLAQLRKIFTGEIGNWRQLGGPNLPIKRFSRPSYSGTHAFFKQRVLAGGEGRAEFAKDTGWIEKSEELVERVAGAEGAIGFVGLGWAHPSVHALALSDGGAHVAPAAATVLDRSYPITRPLLFYTRGAPGKDTAEFLKFVFTPKGQAMVRASGFVPHDEALVVTARTVPQRLSYELLRLRFAEGQATIQPADKEKLDRVMEAMKESENYALIVGNADTTEGDAASNERLAEARARAIASSLQKEVPDARIVSRGDSTGQPVSSNATAEGRAENRRVDVFIVHRQDTE